MIKLTMFEFDKKDIELITACFLLLAINITLVFGEEWYERYNDPDITFYYKNVLPVCKLYLQLGLIEPIMNCDEWYQTDEGKKIVTKHLLENYGKLE